MNWTPPTALDDCDDATVSGPAGGDPGDFFAVGMHTITYEATDGNGNTITCSFKITVADMQLPDAVQGYHGCAGCGHKQLRAAG
ncbi:MAG: HYR domain-containing protein [Saprospirales bacterium]|nr:HYR domain-containing protein [Saprospirales bacterium]